VKQQAVRLHRFVQAVRRAYADRERYLADPDFFDVPLAGLLNPAYARSRAKGIGGNRRLRPVGAGLPAGLAYVPGKDSSSEHTSTTHISVVDSSRNMVALTSSIEQAFGSGMVVPGRGFLLNNQLTDFSAKLIDKKGKLIANRAEGDKRPRRSALERPDAPGGKRPRSSMAPTLVLYKGKPLLTIGSPGGGRIIQYVARVLLDVLDGRKDLQAAISAPHLTHFADITTLEPGLASRKLRARLARLGHRIRTAKQNSGLHGIWIDPQNGMLHGGADPRREGTAKGY
jgi:gamma-glutamyltranspeptidase/glutathione hydrolase